MDDFQLSGLNETKNEYSSLLVTKITPCIIQGIYSIFKEALKLCVDNEEEEKYLMTFQNFLGRVTKWNQEMINHETERIIRQTNCSYLDDLLTCVHITQLKILTCIRVGKKQKKIDIDIPKLNDFIHKVYIEVARRIYKNVYLFEKDVMALQKQKNLREVEIIIRECILDVIRNSMPVEMILRSYLDETVEDDVEEVKEEVEEVLEPTGEVIEKEIIKEVETPVVGGGDVKNTTEEPKSQTLDNIVPQIEEKQKEQEKQIEEKQKEQEKQIEEKQFANDIKKPEEIQSQTIQFNNTDNIKEYNTKEDVKVISSTPSEAIEAPKTIDILEKISNERWEQRKADEEDDEDSDYEDSPLKISDEPLNISDLGIHTIEPENIVLNDDLLGDMIEEL